MDYPEKVRQFYQAREAVREVAEPGFRRFFATLGELLVVPPPPEDGDTWGLWVYHADEPPSLDYVGPYYNHGWPYEIILEELEDPQQFLDWLHHLQEKVWFRGTVAGNFLDAVRDLGLLPSCDNPRWRRNSLRLDASGVS